MITNYDGCGHTAEDHARFVRDRIILDPLVTQAIEDVINVTSESGNQS